MFMKTNERQKAYAPWIMKDARNLRGPKPNACRIGSYSNFWLLTPDFWFNKVPPAMFISVGKLLSI